MLLSSGGGADVARATALSVFGGMLVEPVTAFIVLMLYRVYMERKMQAGLHDDFWDGPGEQAAAEEGTSEPSRLAAAA